MSDINVHSLHTLPVEIIYRILDNLKLYSIVRSMLNVCKRLDSIVTSYHRDEVRTNKVSFFYLEIKNRNTQKKGILFIYISISISSHARICVLQCTNCQMLLHNTSLIFYEIAR